MGICQEDIVSSLKEFPVENWNNLNIKMANDRNGYNVLGRKKNIFWFEKIKVERKRRESSSLQNNTN